MDYIIILYLSVKIPSSFSFCDIASVFYARSSKINCSCNYISIRGIFSVRDFSEKKNNKKTDEISMFGINYYFLEALFIEIQFIQAPNIQTNQKDKQTDGRTDGRTEIQTDRLKRCKTYQTGAVIMVMWNAGQEVLCVLDK